ncbi:lipoprotein-releasing system permease protein [Gracilimonas mengyeensis]|uniref:Lipoprotein-releasing system permease protein n=2 Tax=Gracilimonas mengyeensis TaxID=1302730 RepID=A0A521CW93_9BACT|nr:lipoprotein-releasing system permease protein [Gracilimonas mengyeensis]
MSNSSAFHALILYFGDMKNSGFIARRYLFSRKHISLISTLTFISITGITIGTALLIVVLSVFNGFFDVIKSFLLSYDPDVRVEATGTSTFAQNREVMEKIESLPEVRVISPYMDGKALLAMDGARNEVVDVKGIERDLFFQLVDIQQSISSGVFDISVRDQTPGIIVHDELKNRLNLRIGEDIALLSAAGMKNALTQITVPRTYRFDLRGSYFLQQIVGGPKVFVDIEAAQRLFRSPNQLSGLDIKLHDNDEAEQVKEELATMLGSDFEISTWYDLQKPLYDVMLLEKWGSFVILILIVIVAVLNIIGSLTMIVIQKQRDIGILMSMGYSRSGIKNIFRKQGFYIGLIGCGIGGSLGLLLSWAQMKFGLVKLSSAFIIDAYPVQIRPLDVIIILAASLLLCVLASWYPAHRASKVQPADAVRYE